MNQGFPRFSYFSAVLGSLLTPTAPGSRGQRGRTQMTAIMTPTATSEAFFAAATDHSGDNAISFDRCTDWLLDLHQSTADEGIRRLIADVLEDLRMLGPVDGEFEDVVLGALASVEIAFEMIEGR